MNKASDDMNINQCANIKKKDVKQQTYFMME